MIGAHGAMRTLRRVACGRASPMMPAWLRLMKREDATQGRSSPLTTWAVVMMAIVGSLSSEGTKLRPRKIAMIRGRSSRRRRGFDRAPTSRSRATDEAGAVAAEAGAVAAEAGAVAATAADVAAGGGAGDIGAAITLARPLAPPPAAPFAALLVAPLAEPLAVS